MTVARPPEGARRLFGDELPRAVEYARLLVDEAIPRGLLGPHEAPRVWERHVLNGSVVAEVVPVHADSAVDVGSGAGIPGIPLALVRPDLRVVLLEPLERRSTWLGTVCERLDLQERLSIVRGRAEDVDLAVDISVSRAVAPLERLLPWCVRLLAPGGRVAAIKGQTVGAEWKRVHKRQRGLGLTGGHVTRCGRGVLEEATYVVVADRVADAGPGGSRDCGRSGVGG